MNIKIFTSLLILFSVITVKGNTQKATFDRLAFYSAMAANSLDAINAQLNIIKAASINEKDAYEGALL